MDIQKNVKEALTHVTPGDDLSIAVMARELVRSGMKLDETSLNREILLGLLAQADTQKPDTLKRLCAELIAQGYGPKVTTTTTKDNLIVLNPIKINPSVQGQMPGKGWAFIWELDRECDNFNWLVGAHITVDGRIYTVQGIENMPESPKVGDKLTLLCSALPTEDNA